MRICYLNYDGFSCSVYDSQVLALIRRIRQTGIEVRLVVFELFHNFFDPNVKASRERTEKDLGAENLIVLPKIPMFNQISLGWAIRQFGTAIKSHGLQGWVVHCRGGVSGAIAANLKSHLQLKVITDFRGLQYHEHVLFGSKYGLYGRVTHRQRLIVLRTCERVAATKSDALTAVSSPLASYLRNEYNLPNMPTVIPGAYDEQLFVYSEENRKRIRKSKKWGDENLVLVYCGGAQPYQRPKDIILLFKRLYQYNPNVRLLIITQDKQIFNGLISEHLEVEDSVHCIGLPYHQVPVYLSAADVGVLLRDQSIINQVASPTKIPEYLACGLPIIADGQIGDINDIMDTQRVGWMINGQHDRVMKKILKDWKDQRAWQEKRQTCIKVAASVFSWGQCIENYLHIYSRLIHG